MYVLHILQRYPKGRIGVFACWFWPPGLMFDTSVWQNRDEIPNASIQTHNHSQLALNTSIRFLKCHTENHPMHSLLFKCMAAAHTSQMAHMSPTCEYTWLCVWAHNWRQAPKSLCVCFLFLVVWFGHTNAWCTSTQQSQFHTNINTHTHKYKVLTLSLTFQLCFFSLPHPLIYDKLTSRGSKEIHLKWELPVTALTWVLICFLLHLHNWRRDPENEAERKKMTPSAPVGQSVLMQLSGFHSHVPRSSTGSPPRH